MHAFSPFIELLGIMVVMIAMGVTVVVVGGIRISDGRSSGSS